METRTVKQKQNKYKICADVVDSVNGLQQYENIRMIRVKSKQYNLLIMEDYMPVIGEIDGFVEIIFDDNTIKLTDVHGYYMHKKNKFSLLVERAVMETEKTNGRIN